MPPIDLFHRRKMLADRGDAPDVFQYEELPDKLRTQLCQIFRANIGNYYVPGSYDMSSPPNNNQYWDGMVDILRRELGVDQLSSAAYRDRSDELMQFIRNGPTDEVLSAIEVCCRTIDKLTSKFGKYERDKAGITEDPSEAIDEINIRFRQAGVGYEYVDGEIIKVDSKIIHSEVVIPALTLLQDTRFSGADEEFREAYRKHRDGDQKGAIVSANCAFESTMKTICSINSWEFHPKARASDLLKVLRANNFFPGYLDKSFEQLQATLASGLPEVRNNEGGHGQGSTSKSVPDHVAAFALHLAAAKIVYLCDTFRASEK